MQVKFLYIFDLTLEHTQMKTDVTQNSKSQTQYILFVLY